ARVWHKVGTSFGTEDSPLRTYFSMRNKLLWAEANATRDEWWRLLRGALRRTVPGVRIERSAGVPLAKAIAWGLRGFVRDAARKRGDPQEIAHRRAVIDSLTRRFGDCPASIRGLARAWSEARATAPVESGPAA